MVLAIEDDVSECSNEREILDTYAMLALQEHLSKNLSNEAGFQPPEQHIIAS
jgi:hypothetical protein